MKTVNGLPVYEGEDAAALDEYSEKMAEEIPKIIGENSYDDTAIKKEIQELDDNQIHITTEKADNLNIQDASGQNAKIKLFGISRQKTREGYNLANLDRETYTKNGVTVTNNGDGSFTLNGTSTSAGDLMLTQNEDISKSIYNFENANYLLKTFVKSGSFANSGNVAVQTVCMGQLNGQTSYNILNDRLYLNEFTDTDEIAENSFLARIEMYIGGAGVTFNNYTIQILLAKSNDINLEYEQYGASPSQKYPSEIENTGDNVNLFNKEAVESGKYIEASTGEVKSSGETSASDYINIKDIKELILSGDDIVRTNGGAFYNSEKVYISGFTTNQIWNGIDIPETASYIRVTVTTEKINNIKIEKGKQPTSYSPYNCGNIDITVCNKNLFNIETAMQNYILNDAGIEIASQGAFVSDYILVKKDVNYFSNTRGYTNAGFYDLDKNFIKRDTVAQNATTTFDEDYYIKLNGKMENISAFQFERNSIATDYTENEQQTITFPLAEGQKMFKGSYTANNGIHHKRKQIELNGTENWVADNQAGSETCIGWKILVDDYVGHEGDFAPHGDILCSHFVDRLTYNNELDGISGGWGKWIFIKMKKEDLSSPDLTGFKAFLSEQKTNGTPVTIEYPLAEEEIEPYTEEQQTVYNQLQNAKTYKLVTNVFTENAELEMEYIADTKTYIDNKVNNMQNQLNTINELLSTTNTSAMLLDNMQTDLESEVL